MAKYLIHAIPERMWYVENHLIPSLVLAGIDRHDISVYNDKNHEGNLKAFLDSIKDLTEDTWHLQDDVCISSKFKRQTETLTGIVCGFCSVYSTDKPAGLVNVKDMWYSFPCIRIPWDVGREFCHWIKTDAMKNPQYATWINAGKYDDSLFMEFLLERHTNEQVLNLKPNIVNHIDFLIGGSYVNKIRSKDAKSLYWEEPEIITYWKEVLR